MGFGREEQAVKVTHSDQDAQHGTESRAFKTKNEGKEETYA